MKNCKDAIGKVLAGLRDAEAPVGMERRILHGLEERVAGPAGSGWRAWLPIWVGAPRRAVGVGSLVCGVALAGVVAVGLGIPAVRRLGRAPGPLRRSAPVEAARDVGDLGAGGKSVAFDSRHPGVR